jgi:hypothetical protein
MTADYSASRGGSASRRWTRRLGILSVVLLLVVGVGYVARRTLLLDVARVFLDRDGELATQEKADGVQIVFGKPSPPWVDPLKNVMNPMWQSIGAQGVNYYTFAGPGNLFRSYSERSDPASPYYQAWVGAYVTKRRDGTMPQDLTAWARQVTELDQRSWLAAMGDPEPLAESAPPSSMGSIIVDGRSVQLWHGTMLSHSDLSERGDSPLAMLVGMPAKSSWPSGIRPFHEVTLDGYFACWSDATRRVSIVVYAVAAVRTNKLATDSSSHRDIRDELLGLMKTATVRSVP